MRQIWFRLVAAVIVVFMLCITLSFYIPIMDELRILQAPPPTSFDALLLRVDRALHINDLMDLFAWGVGLAIALGLCNIAAQAAKRRASIRPTPV